MTSFGADIIEERGFNPTFKYLGCVEVFESRGMQVCEEALKVLRGSRRRPVKAILYVSGDGLRVVEDETKGLIVDQTIEKVSFCAPDRNHEKGFSYICRDGTTRRWMCHGFLALKESGERLSHAVGCAFAACLERKQRRDKECGVTMTFDAKNSTFTRTGSFRQTSITDRLQDPQEAKPTGPVGPHVGADAPPVKQVFNPHAIERPHATLSMLQRQGSFRGFNQLNQASPFKRQMSLRISDLPSTLERQRSLSLEGSDFRAPPPHLKAPAGPHMAVQPYRSRLQSLPVSAACLASEMSPIPESSPLSDRGDSVSAMCQQLAQGLSLLSSTDDFIIPASLQKLTNGVETTANQQPFSLNSSTASITSVTAVSTSAVSDTAKLNSSGSNLWNSSPGNTRAVWCPPVLPSRSTPTPPSPPPPIAPVTPVFPHTELPRPDQWLGSVVSSTAGSVRPRAPPLSHHSRAHSLGSMGTFHNANGAVPRDPFDAEWAPVVPVGSTNPFIAPPAAVKAFEVQM